MRFTKLFSIITLSFILIACMPHYSDGVRSGVVSKFSSKGLVFKSLEGTLVQGNAQTFYGTPFNFSVTDPEVQKKIKEAMDKGKSVNLRYNQYLLQPLFTQDTEYLINSVEIVP